MTSCLPSAVADQAPEPEVEEAEPEVVPAEPEVVPPEAEVDRSETPRAAGRPEPEPCTLEAQAEPEVGHRLPEPEVAECEAKMPDIRPQDLLRMSREIPRRYKE